MMSELRQNPGSEQHSHEEQKLSGINRFFVWCLYGLFWLIGLLPFWFLYHVLGNVIYFLIYRVARYRTGVVRSNLRSSFPEKTDRELKSIERKYYVHLAELFVDTIDLTSMSHKRMLQRMKFENEQEYRNETYGKRCIAALGHYGSWEMFGIYAINDLPGMQLVGIYRPLHNRVMDEFYKKMRRRTGMKTVSMKIVLKFIVRNIREDGMPFVLGMIADQTPRSFGFHNWIDFLNHPTGFYRGVDQLAVRFGMPVYFVHISKLSKSHYSGRLENIYDGTEKVGEDVITTRYAAKLEAMIRERPELWMWSHKRWKHTPESVELERNEQKGLIEKQEK